MPNPSLEFRRARLGDVPDIVRMLADDPLGAERECATSVLPDSYFKAFAAIDSDQNNELVVVCLNAKVVGVLQLTFIPYLTYQGSWRALIEGVRVDSSVRSRGIGKSMFKWAIARAGERNCYLVQLTTNKLRPDAKRFYETLGFEATHEGMKLQLKAPE